jgi:hypothetical protein
MGVNIMDESGFYRLKDIVGNSKDFHRKTGTHCKRGVYFWGFTIRDDAHLPKSKDELVIYYIGKSEKNIVERLMQEITQLIFGGFGTIIDHNWLIKNPHKARIFDKQKSDNKGMKLLDPEVMYKSDGLHVLNDFLYNPKIKYTLEWMRERLIFAWISDKKDEFSNFKMVENEMHHIVRTNVLGIHPIKNLTPKKDVTKKYETPIFHSINWESKSPLKDWLIEVNRNIP